MMNNPFYNLYAPFQEHNGSLRILSKKPICVTIPNDGTSSLNEIVAMYWIFRGKLYRYSNYWGYVEKENNYTDCGEILKETKKGVEVKWKAEKLIQPELRTVQLSKIKRINFEDNLVFADVDIQKEVENYKYLKKWEKKVSNKQLCEESPNMSFIHYPYWMNDNYILYFKETGEFYDDFYDNLVFNIKYVFKEIPLDRKILVIENPTFFYFRVVHVILKDEKISKKEYTDSIDLKREVGISYCEMYIPLFKYLETQCD